MDRADTSKLKSALIDAFMLDAEEAIESCPAPVTVSEAHMKRMQEILSAKPRRRIPYRKVGKRVIAILVAALVICLAGCAMFYQQIVDFFVTIFDGYSKVEHSVQVDEFQQTIEEVRVPTVMLDGYEKTEESINSFIVRVKWVNANGERIAFSQTTLNSMYYIIDNEDGDYTELNIGEYVVLKHYYEQWHTYVWKNDYKFCIMSSRQLSEDELLKIIRSIEQNN